MVDNEKLTTCITFFVKFLNQLIFLSNYEENQLTVVPINSEPFDEDEKSLYTKVEIKHEPIEEPINTEVVQEDCFEISTNIIKEENDSKLPKEQFQEVAQFKITLRNIEPPIFRIVEFPSSISFADLHRIIQDAMGWTNCILYDFKVYNTTTGIEHFILDSLFMGMYSFHGGEIHDDKKTIVENYLKPTQKIVYNYNMANCIHDLTFLGMVPSLPEVSYPRCIAGRRACPPEDSGGCRNEVIQLVNFSLPSIGISETIRDGSNYEENQITVVPVNSEPFDEDVKSLYTEVEIKHEPIEEPINTEVVQEDCFEISTNIIKEENDSKLPKEQFQEVAQFKITLRNIEPPIFRIVEFPSSISFADLHSVIQDAMGWTNCNLYKFKVYNTTTGFEHLIVESLSMVRYDGEVHDDKKTIVENYLKPTQKIVYIYDIGNNWIHDLTFLGMVPSLPGVSYPRCIAGRRACPPEDSGGCREYVLLLEILKNPRDPDYQEKFMWLENIYPGFDAERFHIKDVVFFKAF